MKKTFLKSVLLALMIIGINTEQLQAQRVSDVSMENLIEILDLSDLQQDQMSELISKYRGSIDWILSKNEDEEDPDIKGMVAEVRGERDAYRTELEGVLSPDQYTAYRARVDEILTNMFNDLAGIRLSNMKSEIALTDKQVSELTPIIGKSVKSTVNLLFENVAEKMSLSKKLKVKKGIKKIEKEKVANMENILTPAQMNAYQEYREELKAERKSKK